MYDYELEERMCRDALTAAIDRDSPDADTAARAKTLIDEAVEELRSYVADDAEQKAKEFDKGYPILTYSAQLPEEDYKLPLTLGERLAALPRELDRMGVVIRTLPEPLSVEHALNPYIRSVARRAWAEGVARVSDRLSAYI